MFIIYTYIYFKAVPPGEELWHTPFLCHNGTSIDKPPTFQEKIHTQPHKTPVIMFVLGVYMYHTVRIQEYFLHIYVEWYKPYKMYGSIALKQLEMRTFLCIEGMCDGFVYSSQDLVIVVPLPLQLCPQLVLVPRRKDERAQY